MANLGQMIVKIIGDTQDFESKLTKSQKVMKKFGEDMQRIGKSLTMFVTLPILGIGAAAIKSAADIEMQQAAFETMLGSAEKAKTLLQDLTDLAAKTPFQLPDLASGTKTLLAFGIELDDVLPTLKQLGDVSLGNQDYFRGLTLAFGQMSSAGRLMGQDLLQMINAGFNPLNVIAEQTGESMIALKKRMEAGAISADEVAAAFKIATSEGGQFFGGMERASETLTGKFSTLTDNVGILGRSFADILMPALKDIVDWATKLVQKWTAMDDGTKKVILVVAGLVAAVGPLAFGVGFLTTKMIALNGVMVANPAVAIAAGIAALTAALTIGIVAIVNSRRRHKEYQDQLNNTAQAMSDLTEEEQRNFRARVSQDLSASIKRMNDLQQEQIALQESYDKKLEEGIFNLQGGGIAQAALGKAIAEATEDLAEERTEFERLNNAIIEADRILDADLIPTLEDTTSEVEELGDAAGVAAAEVERLAKQHEQLNDALDARLRKGAQRQMDREQEIDAAKELLEAERLLRIEQQNAWVARMQELDKMAGKAPIVAKEEIQAQRDNTLESISLRNSIYEDQRTHLEKMRTALEEYREEQAEADRAAAEEAKRIEREKTDYILSIAQSLTSALSNLWAKQTQAKIDALVKVEGQEDAYDAKVRQIQHDAAERQNTLSTFQILANTAVAVSRVFADVAWPLSLLAAAAVGASAIAQLASLPPVPKLAQGGIVTQPTNAVVGEGGQPEIIFPLDRLQDFLGGTDGPGQHLTINFDSKPIYDGILPATRDRRIMIDARAVV